MSKPRLPGVREVACVADLKGGEIVRLAAGLFRISQARHGLPDRWAILLTEDLRETRDRVWLDPRTPVLEVLGCAESPGAAAGAREVDPLRGDAL